MVGATRKGNTMTDTATKPDTQTIIYGPVEHGGTYYRVTRSGDGIAVWTVSDEAWLVGEACGWEQYHHVSNLDENDWYAEWLLREWS